jgi:6-phosphogluconolactonase
MVEVVPTRDDLVRVAHEIITAAAAIAVGQRQFFRIALAGGSTPKPVYAALAADPDIDWRTWQLFWSDERCVPPTSPDSNYRMVKETLLDKLARPPRLVMRMAGEGEPQAAALAYEQAVREMVPSNPKSATGPTPRFDLIVLGMGSDGHTASLFPHTLALGETEHLVVTNPVAQLATTRLTFTYPLINAARRVLVLVSGADKAAALRAVISGPFQPDLYPSQAVRPIDGTLTWLVDEPAFSEIEAEMRP